MDPRDPENFRRAIRPNTKILYGETLGNPLINVFPFEEVAKIGQEFGIPLMIDNTFATPYLIRPFEWGANIVVHSTTKFIGGHGTSIGGVIVDGGNFTWKGNPRFANFNTPDDSYHGLVYGDAAALPPFIIKARVQILRDFGGCLSPFNSFLFLQGLETLSLRMERHVSNAQEVAEFLEKHPKVTWVAYPGLKSSPEYAAAQKYLPKGAGAILGFGIQGGPEAGKKFIESLKLLQPPGQRGRRQEPGDPPRHHHPQPAQRRAAGQRRGLPRFRAPERRPRGYRGYPLGPRPGVERGVIDQFLTHFGRVGPAAACRCVLPFDQTRFKLLFIL